jgi:hypothetical protein
VYPEYHLEPKHRDAIITNSPQEWRRSRDALSILVVYSRTRKHCCTPTPIENMYPSSSHDICKCSPQLPSLFHTTPNGCQTAPRTSIVSAPMRQSLVSLFGLLRTNHSDIHKDYPYETGACSICQHTAPVRVAFSLTLRTRPGALIDRCSFNLLN